MSRSTTTPSVHLRPTRAPYNSPPSPSPFPDSSSEYSQPSRSGASSPSTIIRRPSPPSPHHGQAGDGPAGRAPRAPPSPPPAPDGHSQTNTHSGDPLATPGSVITRGIYTHQNVQISSSPSYASAAAAPGPSSSSSSGAANSAENPQLAPYASIAARSPFDDDNDDEDGSSGSEFAYGDVGAARVAESVPMRTLRRTVAQRQLRRQDAGGEGASRRTNNPPNHAWPISPGMRALIDSLIPDEDIPSLDLNVPGSYGPPSPPPPPPAPPHPERVGARNNAPRTVAFAGTITTSSGGELPLRDEGDDNNNNGNGDGDGQAGAGNGNGDKDGDKPPPRPTHIRSMIQRSRTLLTHIRPSTIRTLLTPRLPTTNNNNNNKPPLSAHPPPSNPPLPSLTTTPLFLRRFSPKLLLPAILLPSAALYTFAITHSARTISASYTSPRSAFYQTNALRVRSGSGGGGGGNKTLDDVRGGGAGVVTILVLIYLAIAPVGHYLLFRRILPPLVGAVRAQTGYVWRGGKWKHRVGVAGKYVAIFMAMILPWIPLLPLLLARGIMVPAEVGGPRGVSGCVERGFPTSVEIEGAGSGDGGGGRVMLWDGRRRKGRDADVVLRVVRVGEAEGEEGGGVTYVMTFDAMAGDASEALKEGFPYAAAVLYTVSPTAVGDPSAMEMEGPGDGGASQVEMAYEILAPQLFLADTAIPFFRHGAIVSGDGDGGREGGQDGYAGTTSLFLEFPDLPIPIWGVDGRGRGQGGEGVVYVADDGGVEDAVVVAGFGEGGMCAAWALEEMVEGEIVTPEDGEDGAGRRRRWDRLMSLLVPLGRLVFEQQEKMPV